MEKRTKEEWLNLVKQWKNSGKRMTEWCREHQIPKTSFCYHLPKEKKSNTQTPLTSQSFIELTNPPSQPYQAKASTETGVTIEYQKARIHLTKDFDSAVLTKCLKALKEVIC